jgi:hypothetical protein
MRLQVAAAFVVAFNGLLDTFENGVKAYSSGIASRSSISSQESLVRSEAKR